jgi:hypothetical protein
LDCGPDVPPVIFAHTRAGRPCHNEAHAIVLTIAYPNESGDVIVKAGNTSARRGIDRDNP